MFMYYKYRRIFGNQSRKRMVKEPTFSSYDEEDKKEGDCEEIKQCVLVVNMRNIKIKNRELRCSAGEQ